MKIRIHVKDGQKAYDFDHAGPTLTVGRNPAGTIVLEEEAAESVVSWEHARIDLSPREATLTDLRSTNGTYRNGTPVNGTVPLWPNDAVRFGQTGPMVTVKVIDLTPASEPPPLPRPVRAATTVAKPAKVVAKPRVAKPVISETRGIALQAVQQVMAQNEQLRAQHAAQARHRRALAVMAAVALVLFLLLGGAMVRYTGYFHRKTEELAGGLSRTQEDVVGIGESVRKLAVDSADHFGKIEQEQVAQREKLERVEEAAKEVILKEAAKLRGGLAQLKKDFGASLDDLNNRLTEKDKPANPPLPVAADPVGVAGGAHQAAPRIEPGMPMDVIMRDGRNTYKGVLLGITDTMVKLQTNPNAGAKPTEFDIRKALAFQTRDGIFALDEATGKFEPAITYYRLNKSSKMFERSDNTQDAYLAEDAQVFGPVNSARAILAHGKGGEWVLGLPLTAARSPAALEAYHIKEIVTAKGVYTYEASGGDYSYKPYSQLAAEAQGKRDEFLKGLEAQDWKRRVESYERGTERLRALSGYFWRPWGWW